MEWQSRAHCKEDAHRVTTDLLRKHSTCLFPQDAQTYLKNPIERRSFYNGLYAARHHPVFQHSIDDLSSTVKAFGLISDDTVPYSVAKDEDVKEIIGSRLHIWGTTLGMLSGDYNDHDCLPENETGFNAKGQKFLNGLQSELRRTPSEALKRFWHDPWAKDSPLSRFDGADTATMGDKILLAECFQIKARQILGARREDSATWARMKDGEKSVQPRDDLSHQSSCVLA